MNRLAQLVNQTPPVTKYLVAGVGAMALAEHLFSPQAFAWIPSKALLEPWRLLTSLLYQGPLDFGLITRVHTLWTLSQTLEERVYLTRQKYLASLLLLGAIMLALAPLGNLRYPGPALSSALTYIWSRHGPNHRLLLIFVEIPATNLFWFQMLQVVFMGNIQSILTTLMGFAAGHAIFLAQSTYPLVTGKEIF